MATRVRYQIIGAATLAAIMLYVDRVCIAEIVKLKEFQSQLGLTKEQVGLTLSAFFFSYALCQVPAGLLSDRFGARQMLPLYICIWSVCTVLTGLATGLIMLLVIRMIFGIAQAGCYPTAGSLIRRWIPLASRGTASAVVSVGGRLGAAITPLLTAWLLRDFISWRMLLVVYGAVGFLVAFWFWWKCRETPEAHPECDQAERDHIRGGWPQVSSSLAQPIDGGPQENNRATLTLVPMLASGSLWLMCLLQFGINVGWVFLVTWLPTYLAEVKQVDPADAGLMSTVTLTAGVVGMLLGGPLTDFLAMRIGKRWGRSLPMLVCYLVALAAYLSCLFWEAPWAFVGAVALVAFATDLSVPSIWAYMQDVGGKSTASCFGWGNMWGNLGAATTPILVPVVLKYWDTNKDWSEAFLLFAVGYLVAALCALGLNADRPLAPESTFG